MRPRTIGLAPAAALLLLPGLAPAQGDVQPPIKFKNSSALVKEHHNKLKLSCSSFWVGWPEDYAFDGDPKTSWFTAQDDSAAKGNKPWIEVGFPADVEVKRVTVIGNRDPSYPKGYTILASRLELLDAKGKVLLTREAECDDSNRDFDFILTARTKARSVRFTSLRDQGNETDSGDVAVSEIQIE
jgi:F5/8 type C domain